LSGYGTRGGRSQVAQGKPLRGEGHRVQVKFALFNLGTQEVIILLLIGLLVVGGPILALVIVLFMLRRGKREGDPGGEAGRSSD
jgi:hypothetical protein